MVRFLLEAGGDPRLFDTEGVQASDTAANETVREVFQAWDLSATDAKLKVLDAAAQARQEELRKQRALATAECKDQVAMAAKEDQAKQRMLLKSHQELERRIVEYDKVRGRGERRGYLNGDIGSGPSYTSRSIVRLML